MFRDTGDADAMGDSEFFKIVPMDLQEKAKSRANLVDSLSRRSSIFPGQDLLALELALAGIGGSEDVLKEESESDVESGQGQRRAKIPFPYKEVTNEHLANIRDRLGIIDLSFTGVPGDDALADRFPVKYSTWTEKEKLLLVYAENFRRKFNQAYKLRQPLMLAPKNECGIQVRMLTM